MYPMSSARGHRNKQLCGCTGSFKIPRALLKHCFVYSSCTRAGLGKKMTAVCVCVCVFCLIINTETGFNQDGTLKTAFYLNL